MKTLTIKHIPYTYLIGWSTRNKWYFGCRYSKLCNPSDLWMNYFTSSKHVAKYRIQYGEPDIIQVRQQFVSADKCRVAEHKVLRRLKVVNNPKWLNKTDNVSISQESALVGRKNRPSRKGVPCPAISAALKGRVPWNKGLVGDHRCAAAAKKTAATRKLRDNYHACNKGVEMPEEQKKKLRGKVKSDDHRAKISIARTGQPAHNKGVPMSAEQKKKLSIKQKGKQFEKKTCPHCGTVGGGPNMSRFHFDNCKNNVDSKNSYN